ncbi:protein virilizer homolog isoform X2 [Rhizophagus clarus]|uniref:Protein virilizer homolog isoform X2 n=1 Tax=Rhizophagus clarus TaxID=94130 RepID=A0A8H3QEP5_9GLOM|nr:protein virilizer homolog isoform X2 [Rhizophagus clarus]
MTAEIGSNVQKSSSQLLFFDTLTASNFSSDELPTECIRFHQRVVLSEIRVVPKHFRPFKGSRKNDHVGQTSPNKFELNLLIHKTLTADSAKPPEKRPPTLPLHPLTISFDEKKGFLSYDVTLLPEATTRFIILRGNYQSVTLCIYGKVMESGKPQNIKSKDQISAPTICENQHNKKDNLDTFFLNGTDLTNTKPFTELVQSSPVGNNIEIKVDDDDSLGNISIKKENEEKIDEMGSMKSQEFYSHEINVMDSVHKEQAISVINSNPSVQILDELKTTEDQFETPMEEDTFYLDDGHRDTNSDADRIGTLLNKDRAGTFSILSPAKAVDLSIWNLDEKLSRDILVYHTSPDETLLSQVSQSFSKRMFNKAWDEFNNYIKQMHSFLSTMNSDNKDKIDHNSYTERTSTSFEGLLHQTNGVIVEGLLWARRNGIRYDDELNTLYKGLLFALDMTTGKSTVKLFENGLSLFCKLCACGEDIIDSSMIQTCLELVVPLLKEKFVSSTLQTTILRGLMECLGEPAVVEKFLECNNNDNDHEDTLYKTFILPMLQIKSLPLRILHLLQAIVRKVSIYEACTIIQQLADNETKTRKKELMNNYDNQMYSSNLSISDNDVQELDDLELIIDRISNCLHNISKAALYHMALHSGEETDQNYPSIFSFKYLTSCRFFPAITIIISSNRIRSCSRFHELLNFIGRLCVILLGSPIGMIYLAKQLQQPIEPFGDSLLVVLSTVSCRHNDVGISIEEESFEAFSNSFPVTNGSWSNINELRRTPGVGDIWLGFGQSITGGNYDEDYDYICDYNEDDYTSKKDDDFILKKARQILRMQSCGAVGARTDCFDNCIIPSDQLVILLTYQLHAVAIIERLLEYGRRGLENQSYTDYTKILDLLSDLFELTTFNVGKQAVASTLINLDGLPTILSLVNINPIQEHLSASIPCIDFNALGRLPLELLEVVIKFSRSFPFLLTLQIHELVNPFISSENFNLRALWDPIAAFHETGNIQGVIDVIKHQKYYPECLRDHNSVNQILVSLRLLMSYTYTESGILHILKARMDDFSGFDNGDNFLVFLLRLLNHVAEVLSDLGDFVEYAEHQSTSESTFTTIAQDCLNSENYDEPKVQEMSKSSENRNEHSNPSTSTFTQSTNIMLSSEVFELRRELLDLAWNNLTLVRRLLRFVYGDPDESVAKRHFRDIYGENESPDDLLPSQKKSMVRMCVEPWLMLVSALDHLDGRLSDQLGATSLLGNGQTLKNGQSVQIARIRGLILSLFGLLTEIVIEEKPLQRDDEMKESHCKARFFSDFTGRYVVKQLCDFIFEGPNNFLSGLHILSEILPTPLLSQHCIRHLHISESMVDTSIEQNLEGDGYSTNWPQIQREARVLRQHWIKQLLPLRDDLIYLIKNFLDRGIGRGIVAVIVNGVRDAIEQLSLLTEKPEKRNFDIDDTVDEFKREEYETVIEDLHTSSEIQMKLTIFGRWMSLLTSVCGYSSGRSLLLDSVNNITDDAMMLDDQESFENSHGLVKILLDIVPSISHMNFICDIIMEFFFLLCNSAITVSEKNMPRLEDLSIIIDNLLEWVKQGKNGRLQTHSLLILQKIAETELGALSILKNKDHLQLISNMMTWVPDLLRSQDLRMHDLSIAYHSVGFILIIIDYVLPGSLRHEIPFLKDNLGSLPILINSSKDAETILKSYENIEQHIIELPYESQNMDEEMHDPHLCQSVIDVIKRLKDHIHGYIQEVSQNAIELNIDEIFKRLNIRLSEVVDEIYKHNISIRQEVGSVSIGVVIDEYPDFPFYDVVDDFEGKVGEGGLFNAPETEIDFEVFAKEMLPNFQFHKRMKMPSDSAAKGRKLKVHHTLSKLGGVAYESNARRNLGGGKTYQKNEFRSIHNNRKANTSRPPSVHVDDFMSGKIPVNQQHPDMLTTTTSTTTPAVSVTATIQQKKTNVSNRPQLPNKRGGIATTTSNSQLSTNNNRGRGRRPSTSSASARGASRGASSSGRGGGGVGRGNNANANIVGAAAWEMGSGAWTGGPPSLLLMPPMNKYMDFERRIEGQRDYTRYDNQTIRTGYYDNQYYGMPSPMTPYDRPPVQQSAPGMSLRIKNGNETRGRTVPQEWAPRSMTSQPTRRPERQFGRR